MIFYSLMQQQNDIQLYKNVCVIPNQVNDFKQTKQFLGRLKVYDNESSTYSSDYYTITLHSGRALWVVDHEHDMNALPNKFHDVALIQILMIIFHHLFLRIK